MARTLLRQALIAALPVLALLAGPVPAQSNADTGGAEETPDTTAVAFVPPAIGAPSERVSAGTRDATVAPEGNLSVLVPEGGGLTTLERPPLIWHLPQGFDGIVQTQIGPASGGGVVQRQSGNFTPGYYGLDLNRPDLRLKTGVIYRWRISLIHASSGQILSEAWGLAERVTPPEGDASAAASGLWYDALAPYISVGRGGDARITDAARFRKLAAAAGLPE